MPQTKIDYSKTIIYKIQHIENLELLYVGHTTNYEKRKSQHKCNSKSVNQTLKLYLTIRKNGGWDMFKMTPVKEIACTGRYTALIEEDKVMTELKSTLNTIRSAISVEERKRLNREKGKTDKQKKINREKYHANMDKVRAQRRETDLKFEALYGKAI